MQFDEAWTSDCHASCPIHPASNHPNLRRVVFVQSKKESTIHTDGCFLSDGQSLLPSGGWVWWSSIPSMMRWEMDGWGVSSKLLHTEALGWWVVRISPTTRPSGWFPPAQTPDTSQGLRMLIRSCSVQYQASPVPFQWFHTHWFLHAYYDALSLSLLKVSETEDPCIGSSIIFPYDRCDESQDWWTASVWYEYACVFGMYISFRTTFLIASWLPQGPPQIILLIT